MSDDANNEEHGQAADAPAATDLSNFEAAKAMHGEEDAQGAESTRKGSNREAKYRRQLRDAEAERDNLREQLTAMRRTEAERLAGQYLTKPAALWANGTTLEDLLDDDGNLDAERVSAAALDAVDKLGAAAPVRPPLPDPTQGHRSEPQAPPEPWADAFRPSQ